MTSFKNSENVNLTSEEIRAQIPFCLKSTDFYELGEKYAGKVRDNYSKDGRRIIIVTDNLSAFDRGVITQIPFKGQVLNQLARFWFERTGDIVKNHVIEFPDPNVVVAKECKSLPVEMVVRGYLTGVTTTSAWYHYAKGDRDFCGNPLPDGMVKNEKFVSPIVTPSTKAAHGDRDESVSRDVILERGVVTADQFDEMKDIALKLYARGVEIAAKQGIILVDTKYEFGLDENKNIVLIDEIHTPDSSRFWYKNEYDKRFEAGEEQKKIDKEYLREWMAERGFIGEGEIPEIPNDIRIETARRYIKSFELITGQQFRAEVGDIYQRIKSNLAKYF